MFSIKNASVSFYNSGEIATVMAKLKDQDADTLKRLGRGRMISGSILGMLRYDMPGNVLVTLW